MAFMAESRPLQPYAKLRCQFESFVRGQKVIEHFDRDILDANVDVFEKQFTKAPGIRLSILVKAVPPENGAIAAIMLRMTDIKTDVSHFARVNTQYTRSKDVVVSNLSRNTRFLFSKDPIEKLKFESFTSSCHIEKYSKNI